MPTYSDDGNGTITVQTDKIFGEWHYKPTSSTSGNDGGGDLYKLYFDDQNNPGNLLNDPNHQHNLVSYVGNDRWGTQWASNIFTGIGSTGSTDTYAIDEVASANATISNGSVTGLAFSDLYSGDPNQGHGSGYTAIPSVIISGGGGSGASARATLKPTTVSGIVLVLGGSGYVSSPTVSISSTDGFGSGAIADANITNGVITGFTIKNPGSGYDAPPTVTISGGGGWATARATLTPTTLEGLQLTYGGKNYSSPPSVHFSNNQDDLISDNNSNAVSIPGEPYSISTDATGDVVLTFHYQVYNNQFDQYDSLNSKNRPWYQVDKIWTIQPDSAISLSIKWTIMRSGWFSELADRFDWSHFAGWDQFYKYGRPKISPFNSSPQYFILGSTGISSKAADCYDNLNSFIPNWVAFTGSASSPTLVMTAVNGFNNSGLYQEGKKVWGTASDPDQAEEEQCSIFTSDDGTVNDVPGGEVGVDAVNWMAAWGGNPPDSSRYRHVDANDSWTDYYSIDLYDTYQEALSNLPPFSGAEINSVKLELSNSGIQPNEPTAQVTWSTHEPSSSSVFLPTYSWGHLVANPLWLVASDGLQVISHSLSFTDANHASSPSDANPGTNYYFVKSSDSAGVDEYSGGYCFTYPAPSPGMTVSSMKWASNPTSSAPGVLSVTYNLDNSSSVTDITNLQINGTNSTNGVKLKWKTPIYQNNIAAGSSKTITLEYEVPSGTASFETTTTLQDECVEKPYLETNIINPPNVLISNIAPSGWVNSASPALSASYSDINGTGINASSATIKVDGVALAGCTISDTKISCPAYALADGFHDILISVNDNEGATGTATGNFSVDTSVPVVSNISPSGWVGTSAPSITAAFSDGGSGINVSTVNVTLDNVPLADCASTGSGVDCPTSGLAQGNHTITVTVKDNAGNAGTGTGTFSLDLTPPTTIDNAPSGWQNKDITVSLSCTDSESGCATTTYEVDAGATQTGSSVSLNTDGTHIITFRSTDNAGNNESTKQATVQIDKTAPVISIWPNTWLNYDNPNIYVNYSDAGSGVNVSSIRILLDGAPMSGCTVTGANSSCPTSGLLDGSHVISVSVTDNVGNTNSSTVTFSIDTSLPPNLTVTSYNWYWSSPSDYNAGILSVSGTIGNIGDRKAISTEIYSSAATNNVILETTLPLSFGTIDAQGSFTFALDYKIPQSVASFRVLIYLNCEDIHGSTYSFSSEIGPSSISSP